MKILNYALLCALFFSFTVNTMEIFPKNQKKKKLLRIFLPINEEKNQSKYKSTNFKKEKFSNEENDLSPEIKKIISLRSTDYYQKQKMIKKNKK